MGGGLRSAVMRGCNGVVSRKRPSRHGIPSGACVRGDPRSPIADCVDFFRGEGGPGLVFHLSDRRPWVRRVIQGGQTLLDDKESPDKTSKCNTAQHGDGRGICSQSNKQAVDPGSRKEACNCG